MGKSMILVLIIDGRPCEADVYLFSLLALIFIPGYIPPHENYTPIYNYINRIMQSLFSKYPFVPIVFEKNDVVNEKKKKSDSDFNLLLGGICFMVGFAVLNNEDIRAYIQDGLESTTSDV